MGLKEEIEKLEAQRRTALAQAEADRIAAEQYVRQTEIELDATEARKKAVREAKTKLGDEISERIFKVQLTELAQLLNSRDASSANPWGMMFLDGDICIGSTTVLQNDYYNSDLGLVRVTYASYEKHKGYAIAREITKTTVYEKSRWLMFDTQTPHTITGYDIISAGIHEEIGRFGDTSSTATVYLLSGSIKDKEGLTLKREAQKQFQIPEATPETVTQYVTEVRTPNSELNRSLNIQFEQALAGIIRHLPEFSDI